MHYWIVGVVRNGGKVRLSLLSLDFLLQFTDFHYLEVVIVETWMVFMQDLKNIR